LCLKRPAQPNLAVIIKKSKNCIVPSFKKIDDLHDDGGGAVVVVGAGVVGGKVGNVVVVAGVGKGVVVSGVGIIVVRIGTSQPDWPEVKSKFPSVLGQVSNSKQILSTS
jgi:hypothetical protein